MFWVVIFCLPCQIIVIIICITTLSLFDDQVLHNQTFLMSSKLFYMEVTIIELKHRGTFRRIYNMVSSIMNAAVSFWLGVF